MDVCGFRSREHVRLCGCGVGVGFSYFVLLDVVSGDTTHYYHTYPN